MITTNGGERVAGSFRDPSGFLFRRDGALLRQVNQCYRDSYRQLMSSGLYEELVDRALLIPHEETKLRPEKKTDAFRVIAPEPVEFISYPYEWSFNQLRDAALTTLHIQKLALQYDMCLKDANAFNIQYHLGRPVLIDTLSFEPYAEGSPWIAYRQFCQHFLAPLAVAKYRDLRLLAASVRFIDGIPLDLVSRLLPWRTRWRFPLLLHIHLHARSQHHFQDKLVTRSRKSVSRAGLLGLIDSLDRGLQILHSPTEGSAWSAYYDETNYSQAARESKRQIVQSMLDEAEPSSVWDLGANTGRFSRLCAERNIPVIAFDADPVAVDHNYIRCRTHRERRILPLVMDLTNPSPGVGWANEERAALKDRGPADTALALALVHHLAIGNNLPLDHIADELSDVCEHLIIEFVPKSDLQVQRLLTSRDDVFPNYDESSFISSFERRFRVLRSQAIADSERTVHLMVNSR